MKLKEKLCEPFGGLRNETAKELERIADEYAISFANWYSFMLKQVDNLNERFTPKELIEMFREEKRL